MKNRIYFVMIVLLSVAFASPVIALAQSAGGVIVPKATPPEANSRELVTQRKIEILKGRMEELTRFGDSFLKKRKEKNETLRKNSVSEIAFEDVFRMLSRQKAELTIELAGLTSRLEFLKAEATTRTSNGGENDVSNKRRELLQRYVANQTKSVKTLEALRLKGAVSSREFDDAEGMLIESKLRLEEFDAKESKASPALVEALFETSLEIADVKAKLKSVLEMLAKYIDSKRDFMDLQQIKEMLTWHGQKKKELALEIWSLETHGTEF